MELELANIIGGAAYAATVAATKFVCKRGFALVQARRLNAAQTKSLSIADDTSNK